MRVSEAKAENTTGSKKGHTGLSQKEASRKHEKYGPNTIVQKKKVSPIKILLDQFSDFMVIILLACTVISTFMGEITESVTIIAIIAVNAVLGFVQEYKTERTMEALKSLAAPAARVIRDGILCSIPAEQLVPGDLTVLEAGDRVPADAILIEANNLQVDESLLTGESHPVEKSLQEYGKEGGSTDKKLNKVFMGTIVINGRARAVVHSTGMLTEMGRIADMIQGIEDEQTPLQKRLDHLGRYIVYGCLIICFIVSVAGILRGEALFTMLLAGISLAVAAVPEGLPAIVTIALALGVQRMLKRNALIRKLPAVETLGCASVICSDKTGTLTENKMTVRKIYAGESILNVTGDGHSFEGGFAIGNKEVRLQKLYPAKLALEIGGICNNAKISPASDQDKGALGKIKSVLTKHQRWEGSGDPTETAIAIAAGKAGLSPEVLDRLYTRIDELPFDSERKCMTVVCTRGVREVFAFTKGAPDVIIEKCNKIHTANGIIELNRVIKKSIMKINDNMAGEALRVLGVAYRQLDSKSCEKRQLEQDLIFVGLIGMIDPPRREAVEAVRKCRMAGIKPVMITGDHKVTATAIAKEIDIYSEGDRVITGDELDRMDDEMLARVADDTAVYARVSPKHKLMIVRVLKKLGHIVAMTGDGVNDAPAVKEADIGVAMGVTGTDVTKEASSIILMDDNFATIVAAIEEGRVIYNNIRKFIRYMLACNIGEVLTMFLGMLMGLPLPLLPIQILWVNLVTDGLPAIALGLDPPERDIMMRPPRGSKENIFAHGLLSLILFRGILIGLSTLAVFTSVMHFKADVDTARTAAFLTLVITQLIHVFECKSEKKTIFEIPVFNNIPLVISVVISLAMILGVIYIPALQGIFNTVPLEAGEWLMVAGFSLLAPIASGFFSINGK
ncbi:Ca2+-transporting ATPase [Anaerobacterium chartisolvens]|uniref:Ca2+-transporting ATPase n=1 Tax=Anaerobacterium chartisolvens TaxID=1297424 RepID=A0A369BKD9_9FIRM|nr:calcium-translocating P-type ATPase, SERCA-type [Anaerobacterium chartisolvens]RCX20937.1 Ca2+-transporting ATPase [Anaerobacterium chartisolvens]